MKKFILILLMTLTLTSFFAINIFAINVDYTFNITDNKKWNLETGSIQDDLKFAVTSKMIIKDDRIITSSETYHHVVFWNSKNQFIGYKNSQYSILENDYYLGNIEYGSAGFDAPANAHFFSFMIYKSGNSIPIAELNNQSLSDIFDNFTHQGNDTPLSTLNDQSLNEVFDDGNLIINGDFSNGTTSWINSSGTLTVNNGIAQFLATAQYGYSYQTFTTIGNHSYYYSIDFNISNYNQFGNYRLNSITYPINFNNFGYFLDVWNTHSFIATETNTSTNSIFTMRDYNTSNFEPMFYDNVYVIDLTDLGIDNLTTAQMDAYYDAYERTNNNEPINDIISEYAIDYAIANNPTINLTYNEWYDYYNNYLTYQDANDRIESGLNNLTLNDVFLNGNQISFDDWEQSSNVVVTIANNDLVFTSPNAGTSFSRNYLSYDNVPNDKLYFNYILDNQSSGISQLKYGDSSGGYTILTHSLGLNNYSTIFDYYWGFNGNNDNIYLINYSSNSNDYRVLLNSDMVLINLTDLGIDNLTTAQMDAYYDDYIDNQTLEQNLYLQALTPTSFDLIDPNYDYTAPPPDDFLDVDSETFLDNLLTNIGFNNDLGRIGLSLVVLFFTALTLIKLNMPNSVIISVEILTFVGLSFLGWLPAWINIVIALGIIILLYLRFKGNGGGSNEEND